MSQNWANISYGQSNRSDLCEENVCKITYPCPSSTYCSYYKVSLAPGSYLIYVYGAEGGGYDKEGSKGGKGGLSSGVLKLRKTTQYFAFIGAKGVTATSGVPAATFGGGGSGYSNGQTEHTSSGGGASDLRTDANDFNSRIIVSGGGGGDLFMINMEIKKEAMAAEAMAKMESLILEI